MAEVPLDNDGTLEVAGGTLEATGLRDFTGTFSGGRSGLSNGTYVVGAGTLVLPGPVEVNGARLALGAGSQVVYKSLGGQGTVSGRPHPARPQHRLAGARPLPDGRPVRQ